VAYGVPARVHPPESEAPAQAQEEK